VLPAEPELPGAVIVPGRPTLVVLAAGLAQRYGRPKQLDPVGPGGQALLDYAIFDARREGFGRVVLVTRASLEPELRAHLGRLHGALPLTFVEQRLDDLPGGAEPPADRTRPWGTGHAVYAARDALDGRFAVCNADDFYGHAAWAALARHLHQGKEAALVGYTLGATLSAAGGVSRAVCELGGDGRLRSLREATDLVREGTRVLGRDVVGVPVVLPPDAIVSMNLFGLPAGAGDLLAERLGAFLAEHGRSPEAEFYLSEAMNQLVRAGRLAVRVLPTGAGWMGMTFTGDREGVVRRLAQLHAAGAYPATFRLD
jgi:hypothetical protein